jgi:hypothetical protein
MIIVFARQLAFALSQKYQKKYNILFFIKNIFIYLFLIFDAYTIKY